MRGKFADAKVADNEIQLADHGQTGVPDVHGRFAPQLHWPAGPPVLLLAVRKEASRELHAQEKAVLTDCAKQHVCGMTSAADQRDMWP